MIVNIVLVGIRRKFGEYDSVIGGSSRAHCSLHAGYLSDIRKRFKSIDTKGTIPIIPISRECKRMTKILKSQVAAERLIVATVHLNLNGSIACAETKWIKALGTNS